jgi:chromosomal replication initiator protein
MTRSSIRNESRSRQALDRFVLLPENRCGLLAIRRLARHLVSVNFRMKRFPLIYLHGTPGTGKSHLLLGLIEQVTTNAPDRLLKHITAIDLSQLFASLPQEAHLEISELKKCDLLMVEDMQFFRSEGATRFANLIDYRLNRGGCVLVTGSVGPAELSLSLRLTSRLGSGIVSQLEPLSFASRRVFAKQMCRERKLRVTEEVFDWLAQQEGGIRGILGEMNRLEVLSQQYPPPMTLPVIQKELSGETGSNESPLDRITHRVANYFQINIKALKGKSRHRMVLWSRQVGMYLIRELTESSLVDIGSFFGGRDHTTVMNAIEKVKKAMREDAGIAKEVRDLQQALT